MTIPSEVDSNNFFEFVNASGVMDALLEEAIWSEHFFSWRFMVAYVVNRLSHLGQK